MKPMNFPGRKRSRRLIALLNLRAKMSLLRSDNQDIPRRMLQEESTLVKRLEK